MQLDPLDRRDFLGWRLALFLKFEGRIGKTKSQLEAFEGRHANIMQHLILAHFFLQHDSDLFHCGKLRIFFRACQFVRGCRSCPDERVGMCNRTSGLKI